MIMKWLITILLCYSLSMSFEVAQAADAPAWGHGPYRMLFEVDSAKPSAWSMTLGAVAHIVHKVGIPPARLEVLAWGPGLQMLLKNAPDAMEITILQMRGVRFVACQTSMRRLHITARQLAPGVSVVAGGMAELMKRHNEGWAEVKM
ncbi:MAG: DsrE family protein [Anaerolineaceae bacterium]|jgi:intracellular sulfur oxidation DsrE/DsrF family protein|uniref:Uncharacterized protein n=4 Tax=Acidithiobacillaceae TaxID=225058 RepID=A0A1C2ICE5_ACITH|nr:DsrE family protein [Acidithiobacillus thiooxidans]MCK9246878.1 DsrE family protein [Anaerolineaceae bacterium]MBU2752078.1 hypothetical protein [Acidithiobacillus thiooxidans]MBU2837378.1 hypothetical protein [Acidithiobacillus thiooxidans]OCX71521.1 hypothetical protein A6M23_11685 [Acidithiobacillus thiooxidans]OCX73669.1 hypothetical protein A6P07_07955 [Acidithiobacillus thiooxidans]